MEDFTAGGLTMTREDVELFVCGGRPGRRNSRQGMGVDESSGSRAAGEESEGDIAAEKVLAGLVGK